ARPSPPQRAVVRGGPSACPPLRPLRGRALSPPPITASYHRLLSPRRAAQGRGAPPWQGRMRCWSSSTTCCATRHPLPTWVATPSIGGTPNGSSVATSSASNRSATPSPSLPLRRPDWGSGYFQGKPPRGRPTLDHRPLLEGLLWIMRTGVPWRELPA